MATKKPTKKAAAKKVAPTRAPTKAPVAKAPVKAEVVAPKLVIVAPKVFRHIDLLANSGEVRLHFSTDEKFEAALSAIKSAPSGSGGSRTPPPLITVSADNRDFSFRVVTGYSVEG